MLLFGLVSLSKGLADTFFLRPCAPPETFLIGMACTQLNIAHFTALQFSAALHGAPEAPPLGEVESSMEGAQRHSGGFSRADRVCVKQVLVVRGEA